MSFFDGLTMAFQNLFRAKFRSFLTILGVAIGISAIVAFVSIGLGLQKITSDQIASATALTTITVTQKPSSATMEEGPAVSKQLKDKIRQLDGVEKVSGSVSMPTTVINDGTNSGAIVYGLDMDGVDLDVTGLEYGKNLSDENEVVISAALANTFASDKKSLIDKTLTIKILKEEGELSYNIDKMEYKIVGIDNNETANIAYVPIEKFASSHGFENYSSIKVKVESRKSIDPVKNYLISEGYQVATINDLINQIDKVFLIAQIILGLIGGIGLLVSFLGIINTMTISFLERTREIGIMKAIGARGRDIKRLFVLESAIIGFLGGVGGVLVAYGCGLVVNSIVNYLIRENGQTLNLFMTPYEFALFMVVVAVLVSIFAAIYPTWRAQRLSPIEAIRQ